MGSSPGYTTIKVVINNILAQTNKPELSQYLNDTLFRPKKNKPPQGNQARFHQDLARPHRGVNK